MTYLRFVHCFCYYCGLEYATHEDLLSRCGLMHYRGRTPDSGAPAPATASTPAAPAGETPEKGKAANKDGATSAARTGRVVKAWRWDERATVCCSRRRGGGRGEGQGGRRHVTAARCCARAFFRRGLLRSASIFFYLLSLCSIALMSVAVLPLLRCLRTRTITAQRGRTLRNGAEVVEEKGVRPLGRRGRPKIIQSPYLSFFPVRSRLGAFAQRFAADPADDATSRCAGLAIDSRYAYRDPPSV